MCDLIADFFLNFNPETREIELGTFHDLTTGSSCRDHSKMIGPIRSPLGYADSKTPVTLTSSISDSMTTVRSAWLGFKFREPLVLIPLSMNQATETHTRWIGIDWMKRCISQCDQGMNVGRNLSARISPRNLHGLWMYGISVSLSSHAMQNTSL